MHESIIRPGLFAVPVAADAERMCYDAYNDAVLTLGVKPDFVFIGDSITQFWDLPLFFGWDKMILNRGIGGDVPEFILRRFEADVLQLKPEYCVFMAGTNYANEMMDNPWVGSKGASFAATKEKMIRDIKEVIRYALDAGQRMIVGTIPPAIVPKTDRRNELIPLVNEEIKEFCRERNVIVVDYYGALVDPGTGMMRQEYTTDGIHPDARGFLVMTDVVKETLAEHGIEIGNFRKGEEYGSEKRI